MVTTPQDLLDAIRHRADGIADIAVRIEDLTGALGHLGRGLARLAADGLAALPGDPPEDAVRATAHACATLARLWPADGGPLTDLAGALADLTGRDSPQLARAQRWAVAVEVSAAADDCVRALAARLPARAAAHELGQLRQAAAAVERRALRDPPTGAAAAVLHHPVPLPGTPPQPGAALAVEALATVLHTLETRSGQSGPSLRDLRAVLAAAQVTTAHLLAVIPNLSAALDLNAETSWAKAAARASVFADGQALLPPAPSAIVRACATVPVALVADQPISTGARPDPDLADRGDRTVQARRLGNLLPLLGEQLSAVVADWAHTGRLLAYARDLPPVDDMPEERVRQVVAGRRIIAVGSDLGLLRQALDEATATSAALAGRGNRLGWTPRGPGGADPPPVVHGDRSTGSRSRPGPGRAADTPSPRLAPPPVGLGPVV